MNVITLVKDGCEDLPLGGPSAGCAVVSGNISHTLMGEETLTLEVEASAAVGFEVGYRTEVFGRTYYLNNLPRAVRMSGHRITYSVVMESLKYELSKVLFTNRFNGGSENVNEADFSFTGSFAGVMDKIVSELERVYGAGTWQWKEADTGVDQAYDHSRLDEVKTLSFSSENVLSALNTACGQWNAEFRVEREAGVNTITAGRFGRNVWEHTFRYGRGNGLYRLTRDRKSDSNMITRLYAYGSDKNLSGKYRGRRRRLALPQSHESPLVKAGGYVQDDALAEKFGYGEGAVIFDDIYPSREGTVSAVDDANVLKFTDESMDFDLNEKDGNGNSKYLLASATARVHFNTGKLAGYEFSIAGYNSGRKTFTIVPFTDENDYQYPSPDEDEFRIQPGDRYVILDIALPDSYVAQAEAKLASRALEKYRENYRRLFAYSLEVDELFLKKNFPNASSGDIFNTGDYVNISDADLTEGVMAMKVSGFTRDVFHPYRYTLTLSDNAPSSVITSIVRSEVEMQKVIKTNRLSDPARARRNIRTTAELLEMTFDTDGYFNGGRIRPETIETGMIAVGALSQQFMLDGVVFRPDYGGDTSSVVFSEGTLTHLGIEKDTVRIWGITPGTVSGLDASLPYYVYARCSRDGQAGTMVFRTDAVRYDADADFFHFQVGVLSCVSDGFRTLSLTYGSSVINGRQITSGRILSSSGTTYFDLDEGEIGGRIVFSDKSTTESGQTLIEGGFLNSDIINTDTLVARRIQSTEGHIANFAIQENQLVGNGEKIIFSNEALPPLEELIGGAGAESNTYAPGAWATATASETAAMSDGTINLDLEVRTQDMALPYAGILALKALNKAAITNLEQGGMLSVDNHTATLILYKVETGGTLTEKARRDIPAASTDEAVDYTFYIPEAGTYRLEATAAHRMQSTWAQRPEGTPADIYPTYTLGAALGILGATTDNKIRFSGSQEATQIGTDGFYSFWSLLNYLYFSQSQGLKVKGNCIISSPNGENTLTIDDNGISLSVPAGADASEYTAVFTQAGARANIESGEKLKALFGKIKKWFADMKTVAFTGTYSDLTGTPTIPSVPTKVSAFTNDAGYITKAVSDLENYYKKSETYTQTEITTLIQQARSATFQIVQTLPSTGEANVIYLLPKSGTAGDVYDEYLWLSGAWEKIGTTEIDLSDYYTKSQSDGKYINKTGDASNATAAFVEATADAEITSGSTLSVLFGQTKRTFTSLWASLSGKLGKTEKAASAVTAECATADADGKDIRTTYLPRRDKQTLDTDVNTLWSVGSSVVLSHVNTPRTDTYYLVATFGTNGSDCAQIAVPRSGGPAYYRGFNANNNTWTSWEQIRRINDKVTTSDIADAAITAPKLSSDLTLPGTPQVGTPGALNSPSQTIATIGNLNEAMNAQQIGGTNIYRDTLGTSDFYLSATGEMKYRRFLDITPEAKRNLRGQSITVSFDYILENAVVGRGDTGFGFFVKYTDGTNTYVNAFIPAETTAVTKSGRFSATTKIEDKEIDNITSFQPFMYAQTTSGTATVGRPKFEIGTKATQWSPAPEEMARKSELETSISNIPAGNVRFSTGDSFEELYDRGELKGQPGETGPKGDKGDTGPSGLEAIGIRLKVDQGALYWSPESSGDVWHKIADSNNTHFGG